MNATLKKVIVFASLLILCFFFVFVINQTAQVVQLATNVSPIFGKLVFWFLLVAYALLIITPIVLFLKLPKSLRPPKSEEGAEFDAYLAELKKRLISNPHLKGQKISDRADIEEALAILGRKADEVIKRTASTVFLGTAISQNGSLDAFVVLSVQSRMIWRIAHIYYQRPTLRDLTGLYANVAATAFVAGALDDVDVSEHIEPIISSVLGSLTSAVQVASTILINSVLSGSANALLSLRVGIIARRYCGSLIASERRALRRKASVEAAKMLGSIAKEGTASLSKALTNAVKTTAGDMFSRAKDSVTSLPNKLIKRKKNA